MNQLQSIEEQLDAINAFFGALQQQGDRLQYATAEEDPAAEALAA
jgi:tRNA-dihydrouridine synthase B